MTAEAQGMVDRLKKLRAAPGMSQRTFAGRIQISHGTVAMYETGRIVPPNAIIQLICHEFHVNGTWLRTGQGEMFETETRSEIQQLAEKYRLSPRAAAAVEHFCTLAPEVRDTLPEYFTDVAAAMQKAEPSKRSGLPGNPG